MANSHQVTAAFRKALESWPLHDPQRVLFSRNLGSGDVSFQYGTHARMPGDETINLSVNILHDTLYLLSISIDRKYRGQGYGRKLYAVVEEAAAAIGCTHVSMYPSGTTARGDSRAAYMQRLGYTMVGDEAWKELPNPDDEDTILEGLDAAAGRTS